MGRIAFVCLSLLLMTAPVVQAQQGFYSAPGSRVYPINKNVFEVVGNSGRGYILFWCGAAQFARQVLGAGWRDEITISRGLGTSQATGERSAVQFTLNPGALDVSKISSPSPNAYDVGDSKTVTSANGYCHELIFPWRF